MGTEATQRPAKPWDGVVRRSFDCTVRSADQERRSVDVIASTETVDRHGDVLEQSWLLDNYKKNPVVLWAHNRGGGFFGDGMRPEDLLPIGRAENVQVKDGKLEATLVFANPEHRPIAGAIHGLMKDGMLRAVSVGFRPHKRTKEQGPDGKERYRLGDNELMEISVVPIPANPDATAKHIAWEHEQLKNEEIETMTPEEKTAFDAALSETTSVKKLLASSEAKVATLEQQLTTEKAASTRLEVEMKKAADRAVAAEALVIETEIDKLVGKKLVPAQRDEYLALAKEIGIERVKKICATHPDVKLTTPVTVKVGEATLRSAHQPAPASTDDDVPGNGTDELLEAIDAGAAA